MTAAPFLGPDVQDQGSAWIDPSARIFGAVEIAPEASIWCNVVVRAESQKVVIGRRTNIQDFVMVHVGSGTPTIVGENCSITHHVTLHGCDIGDNCLIGIGATIMDGAVIGANSIVAGHSIVTEGTVVPPGSIVAGVPAKVIAQRDGFEKTRRNALLYLWNARAYAEGRHRAWDDPACNEFVAAEMEKARGMRG